MKFTYKKEIAHQKGFFQGTGRDNKGLDQIGMDQSCGHNGKNDGTDPLAQRTFGMDVPVFYVFNIFKIVHVIDVEPKSQYGQPSIK